MVALPNYDDTDARQTAYNRVYNRTEFGLGSGVPSLGCCTRVSALCRPRKTESAASLVGRCVADAVVRDSAPTEVGSESSIERRVLPPSSGWWLPRNPVLSKNTNELKTGAPGRFDRHRLVASSSSGACRRRCQRLGFPVRAGKHRSATRCHAPGRRPGSRLGPHMDQNVLAGYAAVALALILVSRVASFPPPDGLVSGPPPYWRKRGTRKSGLETNAENEARSALLARLW